MRDRLEQIGQATIRDYMPDQHRELFCKLPTLLIAAQDDRGQPWASILCGPSGFVASPDARTLCIKTRPAADDPVARWVVDGASVGLLGIEPHTRRRNRANGIVRNVQADGFDVKIVQSFGNCPKYIHARRAGPIQPSLARPARKLGPMLDAMSVAAIRKADTLFIASASGARPGSSRSDGVDISHRGGRPGFIHADVGRRGLRLTIPDFVGNSFFNTLGNLHHWPRAGLLVPDFDDGSLLHVAAVASIEFKPTALGTFPEAQRLLHLDVEEAFIRPSAMPLRWTESTPPPQFGDSSSEE